MNATLDVSEHEGDTHLGRRHNEDPDASLVLQPVDPAHAIDHHQLATGDGAILTFGTVRETCPRCQNVHLHLVLRQENVRMAHLFCPVCSSCYDAHYPNGAAALTI